MTNTPATPSTTDLNTAPEITLTPPEISLVVSVLEGKASRTNLALWKDDAVFEDPICIARGRREFEAQWYGLAKAFSKSETEYHKITSATATDITWDLHQRYTLVGLGTQVLMKSQVHVQVDDQDGKIVRVQDKWNGKLPDNTILNFFRRANAVTMPNLVGPPKEEQQ